MCWSRSDSVMLLAVRVFLSVFSFLCAFCVFSMFLFVLLACLCNSLLLLFVSVALFSSFVALLFASYVLSMFVPPV